MSLAKKGRWSGPITLDDTWAIGDLTDNTGTAAFELYAGTYYWGSSTDLAAYIKSRMDATSGGRTYTVSVSDGEGGTGKLSMSVDNGTFTLGFADAEGSMFSDLIGISTIDSVSSITGGSHVRALWLPDCVPDTPYHLQSNGEQRVNNNVSIAENGAYYAYTGATSTHNEYTYQAVEQNKAIDAAETVFNQSWETFWEDCIAGGQTWCAKPAQDIRWHEDAAVDGTYKQYNITNVRTAEMTRTTPQWDGLWRIRIATVLDV